MIDRFEHIPGWSTPEMQGELIKHLISKLNSNHKNENNIISPKL